MLSYSRVDAAAIPALRERLARQPYRSCDYTAGVIYMWRDYFSTEYTLCGDTLYIRMRYPDGQVYHLFPCGSEAPALSLSRIAPEADGSLRFATVPPEALDALRACYGQEIDCQPQRQWADYLYPREQLSTYAGRRLAGQRNHVNRFLKDHGSFIYEIVDPAHMDDIRAFLVDNESALQKSDPLAQAEFGYTLDTLAHAEALGMYCGLLRLPEGRTVGVSLGTAVGDTLYVHIEKALHDVAGANQLLCREYAAHAPQGVCYLNREDDMGDEGLRAAKQALHPSEMIEKYTVIARTGGNQP